MSELADRLGGRFIVIDGPDGAGKSTQLRLLGDFLRDQGAEVTETRDPGGTAIGDKIRDILLDTAHEEMTIGCEILLYMASRTQLMGEVIGPAIQRNECVLCDRWVSSTIAYQLAEGRATAEEIMNIYEIALKGIRPDLTIILDVPADVGLARIVGGGDRIEAKGLDFHRKVRELFVRQAPSASKTMAVVDAAGSVEEVQRRLRLMLENWTFAE